MAKAYTMSQYLSKEELYADMKKDIRELESQVEKLKSQERWIMTKLERHPVRGIINGVAGHFIGEVYKADEADARYQKLMDAYNSQSEELEGIYEKHQIEIEALQARIDELMLEYCPEDMTKEQIENWKAHQKPVEAVAKLRSNAELRR